MEKVEYWITQGIGCGLIALGFYSPQFKVFTPMLFLVLGVSIIHQLQRLIKETVKNR